MARAGRGRVIASDRRRLVVRDGRGRVREVEGDARPGDLVTFDDDGVRIVRAYRGPDYPGPETEVARLTPDRMRGLRVRARVLAEIRAYFAAEEFLEVEPPVRVRSPGLEVQIEAVSAADGYLITSPEYSMKRLLAAGLERIYAVCRCSRAGEEGAHHASEFTMLEWYRAYAGLEEILADTERLIARVATAENGVPWFSVAGREINVTPPWERLTVDQAFRKWVGTPLRGDETAEELRAALIACDIDVGSARDWDDLFSVAFVDKIEPQLAALDRGVFVTDWPAPLAALARLKPGEDAVAERFEAYVGGVELANAFGELTDATAQRRRFEEELAVRARRGLAQYPVDERFLAALVEGLPPCAGIALGVDRLAMLAADVGEVRGVAAFVDDEL